MIKKRRHIASNGVFNAFFVVVILVNTVMIGVEVDYSRGDTINDKVEFFVPELVFGCAFALETASRVHRDGWDYFQDVWNLSDYMLCVLSISDIAMALSGTPNYVGASSLRVFRFLRVVRSIKGLKAVAGLWVIIQGLLDSMRTIFWVGCACLLLIYCFAVALTTTIGPDDPTRTHWTDVDVYVGTVARSMLTVLQVVTLDSWCDKIARPLLAGSPLAFAILMMAIVVLSFGTLNILVGVMVDRITIISQDKKESTAKITERTEMQLTASILEEFHAADADQDGFLNAREFRKLVRTPSLIQKLSLLGVRTEDAEVLFETMDVDHSGTITPEEFIAGLQKLKGPAKGQDIVQLITFAQKECLRAVHFVHLVSTLSAKVDEMQERLDKCGVCLSHEVVRRNFEEDRDEEVRKQAKQLQQINAKLQFDRSAYYPELHDVEEIDNSAEWGFVG
eukprot:TRINITY_DN33631_c0_g1_i1.p1 TRINITY_DN33631_c0_g1~~TRINITY_DN33631_c0_g1_i1.p1  ORF type:complete len:506 (-),score=76.27 TRINITY_DN33631_c0_g1_i1:77-1426(-)